MAISPLGLPGSWRPQQTLRYYAVAQAKPMVALPQSSGNQGLYQAIAQQALGALGGSRGYAAYAQAMAKAQASEAKTNAEKELPAKAQAALGLSTLG